MATTISSIGGNVYHALSSLKRYMALEPGNKPLYSICPLMEVGKRACWALVHTKVPGCQAWVDRASLFLQLQGAWESRGMNLEEDPQEKEDLLKHPGCTSENAASLQRLREEMVYNI